MVDIPEPIKVNYKVAKTAFAAQQLLQEIKQYSIFAWDFETSVKYTPEQRAEMEQELILNPTRLREIELKSALSATALDHPSHCTITHCSIAVSDDQAYVFILNNTSITNLVLNFLVSTTQKQVLHNASYDFKHLLYHTGKFPIDYEDTQIFAKTLVNHVDTYKANTKLKELAGHVYGKWAISPDNFDVSHMYDEHVLLYSAIDACATMWLWNNLNSYVGK